MLIYPMQIFQYEFSTILRSIINEIMEFFLNQKMLKAINNSIDQILGKMTIFNGLDFNILQMPLHLPMQLFHHH